MRKRKLLLSLAASFLLVLLVTGAWVWRAAHQAAEQIDAFYFRQEGTAAGPAHGRPDAVETLLLWIQNDPLFRVSTFVYGPWDYACFVPPYYDLEGNPKLAGVAIPWIANDGFNTIVVRRNSIDEVHQVSRGDVVRFELFGLSEGEICYEGTTLSLRQGGREGARVIGVMPGA